MYNGGALRPEAELVIGRRAEDAAAAADQTALVGNVGKTNISLALTDARGNFIESSIRSYTSIEHSTVSGAIMAFAQQSALAQLPSRCALAVAGVPRGDTISITNSRWFISKSGIGAMLKRQPLVINDFAANVWAVSATAEKMFEPASTMAPRTVPGTFVVVGMGAGLGVAAFIRDASGAVTVLPTEAGHMEILDSSPEIAPYLDEIRKETRTGHAETLLSSGGLAALRNAIAKKAGIASKLETADEVLRASVTDPHSRRAADLFSKSLWRFAGNLVLAYGAWDGVFFTGPVVYGLRTRLRQPEIRSSFAITGPYAGLLRPVPAGILVLDHSELRGAAEAIRHQA